MTYQGTQLNCQSLVPLMNKLDDYPRVGVHVGGGVHVAMPPTWDGSGKVPPGWTAHHTDAIVQKDAVTFEIPTSARVQDAPMVSLKLNVAEQTQLTTILTAGAIVLSASEVK